MTDADTKPRYSRGEEIANSLTHGIGMLLSAAGLVLMAVFSAQRGDARQVVGTAIFGASLVFLYTASTLYHGIPSPSAKKTLRTLDHSAIFLLIAGTYTPFTLVSLRGPWGWTLFGVIWGAAAFGFIVQFTPLKRSRALSLILYLAMGWAVVAAARPLRAAVPPRGILLLLLGGLCYTGGVAFYLRRKLPYGHAVWHLFVLAGSVFHFFAVFLHVISPP